MECTREEFRQGADNLKYIGEQIEAEKERAKKEAEEAPKAPEAPEAPAAEEVPK